MMADPMQKSDAMLEASRLLIDRAEQITSATSASRSSSRPI
jgi:hypothetical protein